MLESLFKVFLSGHAIYHLPCGPQWDDVMVKEKEPLDPSSAPLKLWNLIALAPYETKFFRMLGYNSLLSCLELLLAPPPWNSIFSYHITWYASSSCIED